MIVARTTTPLAQLVADACRAYERRHSACATVVTVCPEALAAGGGPQLIAGVRVIAHRSIAPGHALAGRE